MNKEKVPQGIVPQQIPMQPIYTIPPAWNEVCYGPIRLASNMEDMATLMRYLKKIMELENRRANYIG